MKARETLAIDGGATHTRAGLYDAAGTLVREISGGPCNPIAYSEEHCLQVLVRLAEKLEVVAGSDSLKVCAAISGANSVPLRARIAHGLAQRTGAARVIVSDDVWPLLAANAGRTPAILVIAGTGATVLGQRRDGRWARAGGRGPLLGDEGGGYSIAVAGLHAAAHAVDGLSESSSLSDTLVAATGVDNFEALPAWCARAGKADIAGLATVVLANAEQGDNTAKRVVTGQAEALARHVSAVARRLDLPKTASILLYGGLFEKSVYYRSSFTDALRSLGAGHPTRPVAHRGHAAVFRFAGMSAEVPPEIRAAITAS